MQYESKWPEANALSHPASLLWNVFDRDSSDSFLQNLNKCLKKCNHHHCCISILMHLNNGCFLMFIISWIYFKMTSIWLTAQFIPNRCSMCNYIIVCVVSRFSHWTIVKIYEYISFIYISLLTMCQDGSSYLTDFSEKVLFPSMSIEMRISPPLLSSFLPSENGPWRSAEEMTDHVCYIVWLTNQWQKKIHFLQVHPCCCTVKLHLMETKIRFSPEVYDCVGVWGGYFLRLMHIFRS